MPRRHQWSALFGWLAIGAVMYHAVAMVFLHRLAPEVSPLADMVSAYLGSQYQLVARSTFLTLACTLTFLGLGLLGRITPSVWAKISAPLLIVAIVGFLGVAGAPQAARLFGIPTQPATVVSILLLSVALRHEPGWRSISGVLVAIGALLVTLFLFTIVLGIPASMGLGGLANRVVLVLIYVWAVLVARGLVVTQESARANAA